MSRFSELVFHNIFRKDLTKNLMYFFVMFGLICINANLFMKSSVNDVFLSSQIMQSAQANESTGDRITTYTNDWTTDYYTTDLGCPEGEVKNCAHTYGTTTTSCPLGGSDNCYPGTSNYDNTYCGDCEEPEI